MQVEKQKNQTGLESPEAAQETSEIREAMKMLQENVRKISAEQRKVITLRNAIDASEEEAKQWTDPAFENLLDTKQSEISIMREKIRKANGNVSQLENEQELLMKKVENLSAGPPFLIKIGAHEELAPEDLLRISWFSTGDGNEYSTPDMREGTIVRSPTKNGYAYWRLSREKNPLHINVSDKVHELEAARSQPTAVKPMENPAPTGNDVNDDPVDRLQSPPMQQEPAEHADEKRMAGLLEITNRQMENDNDQKSQKKALERLASSHHSPETTAIFLRYMRGDLRNRYVENSFICENIHAFMFDEKARDDKVMEEIKRIAQDEEHKERALNAMIMLSALEPETTDFMLDVYRSWEHKNQSYAEKIAQIIYNGGFGDGTPELLQRLGMQYGITKNPREHALLCVLQWNLDPDFAARISDDELYEVAKIHSGVQIGALNLLAQRGDKRAADLLVDAVWNNPDFFGDADQLMHDFAGILNAMPELADRRDLPPQLRKSMRIFLRPEEAMDFVLPAELSRQGNERDLYRAMHEWRWEMRKKNLDMETMVVYMEMAELRRAQRKDRVTRFVRDPDFEIKRLSISAPEERKETVKVAEAPSVIATVSAAQQEKAEATPASPSPFLIDYAKNVQTNFIPYTTAFTYSGDVAGHRVIFEVDKKEHLKVFWHAKDGRKIAVDEPTVRGLNTAIIEHAETSAIWADTNEKPVEDPYDGHRDAVLYDVFNINLAHTVLNDQTVEFFANAMKVLFRNVPHVKDNDSHPLHLLGIVTSDNRVDILRAKEFQQLFDNHLEDIRKWEFKDLQALSRLWESEGRYVFAPLTVLHGEVPFNKADQTPQNYV